MQNSELQILLQTYSQLCEEARYRDKMLIDELSYILVGISVMGGITLWVKEIFWIHLFITVIGAVFLFAILFSLHRLAETRDTCWNRLADIEEYIHQKYPTLPPDFLIRETIVRRIRLSRYFLAKLGWKKIQRDKTEEWKLIFDIAQIYYYIIIAILVSWIAVNVLLFIGIID